MALVLGTGIQVGGRIGAFGGLLCGPVDRIVVQCLAAQRLLHGSSPERYHTHVGEAHADVLADVAGLLDERRYRDHRPVLAAAVELLVAEAIAIEHWKT